MRSRKARARKNSVSDPYVVATTCAWCGRKIPAGTEIFSLGVKVKSGIDTKKQGGHVLSMFLAKSGKTVNAIVTTDTSQAKKDGNDIVFALCSNACAEALRLDLSKELDMVDRFQ